MTMVINKKAKLNEEQSDISDRIGILLSALCCIHCMAIPFLIIFAPAMSDIFQNEIIHTVAIVLVVPVGLYSFISKLKVHKNKTPLFIGILGMLTLISGHLFHEFSVVKDIHIIEIISSIVGGVALVVAHIYNVRLCRCKTCEH